MSIKFSIKYLACLSLVLSLLFVFSACSTEAFQEKSSASQNNEEIEVLPSAPPLEVNGENINQKSTFSGNFYFQKLVTGNATKYGTPILTCLNSNGEISYFCNLKDCKHDSMSCGGYSDVGNYCFFEYKDELYSISTHQQDPLARNIVFYKINKDSYKDSEKVLFMDNYTIEGASDNNIILLNDKLYISVLKKDEDNYIQQIISVNLTDFSFETIIDRSEWYFLKVHAITNNILIYSAVDNDLNSVVKMYNLIENKDFDTITIKNAQRLTVLNDTAYYYVPTDRSTYKVNLLNNTGKELVLDLSKESKDFGSFWSVIDGHLTFNKVNVPKKPGATTIQEYSLNLENGEILPINLQGVDDGGFKRAMIIQAEFDNKFLVAKNYLTPTKKTLCLIDKNDYWNSIDTLQEIGTFSVF